MKPVLLLCLLALLPPPWARSEEPHLTLYNCLSKPPTKSGRAAEQAFAHDFKIVEIQARDGFRDARLKGEFFGIQDPRSMRQWRVPGKVTVAYVVDPAGRVTETRVLESSDPLFAKATLSRIASHRFVPAHYRGEAVFSLFVESQEFGSTAGDETSYRDGLGIMGYRDR